MDRDPGWQRFHILVLVGLSIALYFLHFLIFRDLHHISIFLLGDIAFVFFEVLLVAMVIDRILHRREQKVLKARRYMLTGAFFSEMGTELLRRFGAFDADSREIAPHLATPSDWSEAAFLDIRRTVERHEPDMCCRDHDLECFRSFLLENRSFLLDLLQNPDLVHAEEFANLVWAVFHLTKELQHRPDLRDLADLPESDRDRLTEDMKQVYQLLLLQWTAYMNHLRTEYPHLFAMAERTNPFRGAWPSGEVK